MSAPEVSRTEVDDLGRLHVALLLQLDQTDRAIYRLKLWTLTLSLLLLSLTIIVLEIWCRLSPG